MNHRSRVVFLLLSFAVVLPLIAGGFVAASEEAKADAGRDSLYKYLTVFTEVFGLARRAYVDEPPSTQLMDGALAGAAEALDPFSFYLPADAVAPYLALHEDANRSVRRSGLRVLKDRGVAYAFAVLPDGPADDAGLMRGDVLAMIDGRSTRDMALWEIESTLAGAVDETVEIERIRLGEQRSVTITFRDTPLPGVTLEARDGLPVLRFDGFHAGTVDNVATSLRTLDAGTLPEIDPAL
ncbi:MAG: PDZ domain-containing protein, partial [Acidobacteriota bacterium]